jgi:hypothetical protein
MFWMLLPYAHPGMVSDTLGQQQKKRQTIAAVESKAKVNKV